MNDDRIKLTAEIDDHRLIGPLLRTARERSDPGTDMLLEESNKRGLNA